MKVGDLVFMNTTHETNCGKEYPQNSIGVISVTAVPDSYGEIRISFPKHRGSDFSWIPKCKIELVPKDRLDEAKKKFDKAKEEYKNAVL